MKKDIEQSKKKQQMGQSKRGLSYLATLLMQQEEEREIRLKRDVIEFEHQRKSETKKKPP